ncbi:AAA family ATPase [Halalkalibacter nanhaiisediminis]|uniref:ClpA/ClpB-like protein n=1 Tax=Halalkalibacter nanhaiisediminis TaxID=688079 RepID=A0A562QH97_9BACI|nr:AAA family ATPase [Halalkalibacter nanhaiisediminis]TWI56114.1 ClpA/ClpB-like protein [Halalkalibacter nanhaiisediminis]
MSFISDKLNYYEKENKEGAAVKNKMISRFTFDIETIMMTMNKRIFGQDKAMNAIENMLKLIKADIADHERPLYIGLFLGPTGVGKTEIVRLLAEAIYGDRDKFCRIDMNTLASEHYSAALTGAPPGYVGSKEETTLFDKSLIEGTFSKPGIVLFDEVEKANEAVILTLLNIFDNGRLKITSGNTELNFRNSIVIMTSNIGAKEILNQSDQEGKSFNEDQTKKIIQEKLEEQFAPEFINRIDDVITFNWLGEHSVKLIIDQRLDHLRKKLQIHNRSVQLSDAAKNLIIEKGYDIKYGARSLKRAFRKFVEIPVADMLLRKSDSVDSLVFYGDISTDERAITFREVRENQ